MIPEPHLRGGLRSHLLKKLRRATDAIPRKNLDFNHLAAWQKILDSKNQKLLSADDPLLDVVADNNDKIMLLKFRFCHFLHPPAHGFKELAFSETLRFGAPPNAPLLLTRAKLLPK